jgi:hypothetical protein
LYRTSRTVAPARPTPAQPRELADYAKAFAGLAEMAVHGEAARALIQAAIDALE